MNTRDSEIISQSLCDDGYSESQNIEDSSLVILNTCSIRAKAEQKVMSLLGSLRKLKKRNPALQVCVAGCVAQQEGEKIIQKMPHVNLVVGTQNIYDIPLLLKNKQTIATTLSPKFDIPKFIPNKGEEHLPSEAVSEQHLPFRKFVTIMQGCNNYCTYCVVPYTRGREVSRKHKDIINEVKVLVDTGVKEITLLGQNVNSYGLANSVTTDSSDYFFQDLLIDISEIQGLQRLRFTTSHPKDLSDNLMRCFRDIKILCPQFHLPVQAGSDSVLQRMNRKYTIDSYLEKVRSLREYCPDIVITTDIIVGFPGETDEDFEQTMNLLEKVRFAGSFSFKYSDRPGTTSSEFEGKISENIKSQRLTRFQKRQDEISLEHNNGYVGKIMPVLIEAIQNKSIKSRTETNHIVHIKTDRILSPGTITDVKIVHAGQHSLQGAFFDQ